MSIIKCIVISWDTDYHLHPDRQWMWPFRILNILIVDYFNVEQCKRYKNSVENWLDRGGILILSSRTTFDLSQYTIKLRIIIEICFIKIKRFTFVTPLFCQPIRERYKRRHSSARITPSTEIEFYSVVRRDNGRN